MLIKSNLLKDMSNVFMRIVLFFDLPSVTKKEIRDYTTFVKNLKKLGFVRMQESVFTKLALNPSVVNSCISELKKKLPPDGIVSVLTITENQFTSMEHLIGEIETDVIMSEEKVVRL